MEDDTKTRCKKKDSIPYQKVDGIYVLKDKDRADAFNKFFASVFTAVPPDDPKFEEDRRDAPPPIPMMHLEINRTSVLKHLNALDGDKSPGPDGIYPIVLKELAEVIASSLTTLFQKSIYTGQVPSDWKQAHVCPIHKKEEQCLVTNYKPISLTSISDSM
jgi:hypothetical protein